MKAITVLVGAACALFASAATAQERLPVRDAKQLMLSALDAPDGKAHGVLVGEVADAISKRFNATTPIYIDVSTEKRYAQPGCSRLNVRFCKTACSCRTTAQAACRHRGGRPSTSASTTAATASRRGRPS